MNSNVKEPVKQKKFDESVTMEDIIYYFTWKYKGDWESIYNALNTKEDVNEEEFAKVYKNNRDGFINLLNKIYPENLKEIYKPPFSLFVAGNWKLLDEMKNKETLSVTNLTSEELKDFKRTFDGTKDKYFFCVTSQDRGLIDYLNKNDFTFMIVSEMNIEKTKKEFDLTEGDIHKNKCLLITEVPANNDKTFTMDYSFSRVWSGLTLNAYIGSEKKKEYVQSLHENLLADKQIQMIPFKEFINANSKNMHSDINLLKNKERGLEKS